MTVKAHLFVRELTTDRQQIITNRSLHPYTASSNYYTTYDDYEDERYISRKTTDARYIYVAL